MAEVKCPGYKYHKFTVGGKQSPTCLRCGAINPNFGKK